MRLIDATRLVKLSLLERDKIPLTIVDRYSFGTQSPNRHGQSMRGGIRKILRLIESAPTIDAVPVVRCGDCAHWKPCEVKGYEGHKYCEWAGWLVGENGYCVYGEKKDEES